MSARDHALLELDHKHLPGWPPNLLRLPPREKQKLAELPADPRDRALAQQIINGVVKNQIHLRHLIAHFAGRSLKSIDPLAQKILAVALYQLRFLTRVPASAAVNEAVSQAKRFGLHRAAGFINAILRNATRQPAPPPPDRQTNPADYAEQVLSHPRALFERFVKIMSGHGQEYLPMAHGQKTELETSGAMGKYSCQCPPDETLTPTEAALRLCEHNNAEPPTIVRLFAGRSEADLQSPDITLTPHVQPGLFVIEPVRPAILADWSDRGIAQVQDPTAAGMVARLDPQPGQTVLDRCAGLGTKTLQLHERVGPSGRVLAMDPSELRYRTLTSLLERRQLANIAVRPVGMLGELPPDDPRSFDCILIDAPCSNSGVLARRPEARYAQTPEALSSLADLQLRILDDTAPALKPGGRMLYSTCSIWPEENGGRIAAFLQRHPEYSLVEEQTILPSLDPAPAHYHDGGYYALLTRRG